MLSSTRTLITSLARTQKSDTWYLEMAFYILVGTIIWLLFRRLLYGPTWYLIWLPLRLIYRITFGTISIMGISGGSTSSTKNIITTSSQRTSIVPATTYSVSASPSIPVLSQAPTLIDSDENVLDRINNIASESHEASVEVVSSEFPEETAVLPRNTLKRMYEEPLRDEL